MYMLAQHCQLSSRIAPGLDTIFLVPNAKNAGLQDAHGDLHGKKYIHIIYCPLDGFLVVRWCGHNQFSPAFFKVDCTEAVCSNSTSTKQNKVH